MQSEATTAREARAGRALAIIAQATERPFGDLWSLEEITRALYDHDDGQALIERLAAEPAAVRLLIERTPLRIEADELARCAAGSLGAALWSRHNGLPLVPFEFGGTDVHAFVERHLVATAPLWSEVLGVEAGDDARMLLLGFYAAQLSPTPTFLALIAKNLLKVAMERADRHDEHVEALMRGWVLGRRVQPLFAADWAHLVRQPLVEVRARFGVAERDAEENARLTSASFASQADDAAGVDRAAFLAAFQRIVLQPYGDAGFANGQALREASVTPALASRFAMRLLADPEVMARAQSMPRLGALDFAALHALPEGTLGRVYGDHMLVKGFEPPPAVPEDEQDLARFFTGHVIETHDIWHAVTGAGTDKRGECALHAFYNGQLHPIPVQLAYLARCILKTTLFDLDRTDVHMDAMARGWTLGRQAKPLALVDWRTHFDQPLREVRARFNIPPGGVDEMRLD